MDRADYFEAKAALQNLSLVQLQNEAREQKARAVVADVLSRLGLPVAPAYTWDDTALTITPVEARHG